MSLNYVYATMKLFSLAALPVCLIVLAPTRIFAAADERGFEQALQMAHRHYTAAYETITVPTPPHYVAPLRKVFGMLFARAALPPVPYEIRVIKQGGLNATTTGGPYFTITLDLLQAIDARAKTLAAQNRGGAAGIVYQRELLLAGVFAHEIGHYLAGHGLRQINRGEQSEAPNGKRAIERSQEEELDADKIGYQLMESAGYGGENMYLALRLLHDKAQENCASAKATRKALCHSYTYADSHPALHARLMQFNSGQKKFHEEMLKLELAVAAVIQGTQLKPALEVIDHELKKQAQNSYFLKIRAFALHKLWLESVPISEQQLRAILAVPPFHDRMASGKRKAIDSAEIPGDRALYIAAAAAYRNALKMPQPDYFQSAFCVLLAYDSAERGKALQLSTKLAARSGEVAVLNNHAVIQYLNGKKREAQLTLASLAGAIDAQYASLLQASSESTAAAPLAQWHEYTRRMQVFDAGFVPTDFTPLLNSALIAAYTKGAATNRLAAHYLQNYDSTSDWARRLATLADQKLPANSAGDEALLKRLQNTSAAGPVSLKPADMQKVAQLGDGGVYYREDLRARIVNSGGGVRGLTVYAGSPLKIDGKIGIGSTRNEVEELWGKSQRVANGYTLYGSLFVVGIRYENDRVAEFVLSAH